MVLFYFFLLLFIWVCLCSWCVRRKELVCHLALYVIYGLSVSFPETEIVIDTELESRIKLSAS